MKNNQYKQNTSRALKSCKTEINILTFHNDGAATVNARSPSMAFEFTGGIGRSRVLEPLRL